MLRAACKIPGVQVVVTALRRLLPDLTNVLAVGLLFYYIFSVSAFWVVGRCIRLLRCCVGWGAA
eukprot:1151449-Pelagomonas_calceolata.AAC.2